VATWIVLVAALVLVLLAGGVVLAVVVATRERTKPVRLPGFKRLGRRGTEGDG
jgi:hypothetical protein